MMPSKDPKHELSAKGRAALAYAALAWYIFPVHSIVDGRCTCGKATCPPAQQGKHPVTKRGHVDASTDPKQITRWWRAHPEANVGIATGRDSGLVVIDKDKGPGKFGDESLEILEDRLGKLPPTVEQITGSGGGQLFFRYPITGQTIRSRRGFACGIDIRANGGYSIVPPSSHKCGNAYAWEASSRPDAVPLADLPPAWIEALCDHAAGADTPMGEPPDLDNIPALEIRVRRATNYLARMPAAISGQGGHDATFKAAFVLVRGFCLPSDDSLRLLTEYNKRCEPAWSDKELRHKIAEALSHSKLPWGYLLAIREAGQPAPEASTEPTTQPEAPQQPKPRDWHMDLIWKTNQNTGESTLIKCFQNALVLLKNDPEWAGVLGFDAFAQNIIKHKPAPWQESYAPGSLIEERVWRDDDSHLAVHWISRKHGLLQASKDMVTDAVITVARSQPFHPVRDYLDSLVWDRTSRLSHWIPNYFGAPDTDYHRLVGRWWLISAVARIYRPGCKVDHVPVFEGDQGKRKSTALRALMHDPSWFFDSAVAIGNKDAYQVLPGHWLLELAELDALNRAETSAIKAFVTSQSDCYRPSYGRLPITVLRQCVFAGSTNEGVYLRDPTGNRRFWPISCGEIDIPAITRDRDQLWAEARNAFQANEHWWPEDREHVTLCTAEQDARAESDEWETLIGNWLGGSFANGSRQSFTLSTILGDALGFRDKEGNIRPWSDRDQKRAARALSKLGWFRTTKGSADVQGFRPWIYERLASR